MMETPQYPYRCAPTPMAEISTVSDGTIILLGAIAAVCLLLAIVAAVKCRGRAVRSTYHANTDFASALPDRAPQGLVLGPDGHTETVL